MPHIHRNALFSDENLSNLKWNNVLNWVLANKELIATKTLNFKFEIINQNTQKSINAILKRVRDPEQVLLQDSNFARWHRKKLIKVNLKGFWEIVERSGLQNQDYLHILDLINQHFFKGKLLFLVRTLSDRTYIKKYEAKDEISNVQSQLHTKEQQFFALVDAVETLVPFLFNWNVVHDYLEKAILNGLSFELGFVKGLKYYLDIMGNNYCPSIVLEYFELKNNLPYAYSFADIHKNVCVLICGLKYVLKTFFVWTNDMDRIFTNFLNFTDVIEYERNFATTKLKKSG